MAGSAYYAIHSILRLLPLALGLRGAYLFCRLHTRRGLHGSTPGHEVGATVLMWYLLYMFSLTVNFRLLLSGRVIILRHHNFVPFAGIAEVVSTGDTLFIYSNLIGNVLLLFPLGLLLPLLWKGWARWYRSIPAAALLSAGIEFVQYYSARTTDVDDWLLNTIGAALGYLCFVCVKLLAPRLVAGLRRGRWVEAGAAAAAGASRREPSLP